MKQFLAGRYAPVTFGAAFLKLSFHDVVDDYVAWWRRNSPSVTTEPCDGPLHEALDRLAPLTAPGSKELLIDVEGKFTAILSNSLSIGGEHSRAAYWAMRTKCEALAVTCVPDRQDDVECGAIGVYRSMQVQLLSGHESTHGESRRTVTAGRDGDRWVFFTHGNPLPFEDVEKLSRRRVRDRFGPEDVMEFCRYFGLSLAQQPTCSRALLLNIGASTAIQRSLSFVEARQKQGIEIVAG